MKELSLYANSYPGAQIRTIYFGGGTPSFLPSENLDRIMRHIRHSFEVNPNCEITLEANPVNLTYEKLNDLRAMGVNRLSIGVQSFKDHELKFLTRNHNSDDARESIVLARKAGFNNISIDLMFGLPGQNMDDWKYNINETLSFYPEHVSVYNLTVEERTYLNKLVLQKKVTLADEEHELEMFLKTIELLTESGYEHYEISNFARTGFRSKHNGSYWQGLSYLGVGPSAHSFDGDRRWWNVRDIKQYCEMLLERQVHPVEVKEELSIQQKCMEYVFLNLRKKEGMGIRELETLGGFSFFDRFKKPLEKTDEFIIHSKDRIRLNQKGFFLYNKICEEFVSSL